MIFPLKLVVNDNTKKFDMAYLLYWMVINDNSLLQARKVFRCEEHKICFFFNVQWKLIHVYPFIYKLKFFIDFFYEFIKIRSIQKRFVSSANRMGINNLDTDGKSLM